MSPESVERAAARAADIGRLVLRLGAFAMLLTYHVRPKLAHFDAEMSGFPDPLGIGHPASFIMALLSEGGCSVLVALGIAARLTALPVVFTMSMVLMLSARGFEGADVQSALLYALPYVSIALLGPGPYSVDARLGRFYDALFRRLPLSTRSEARQ
jgi:putative oxidoreductase